MTRIVLLAHAPLATALREVAAHAFPECAAGLEVIDVQPGQSADDVESLLRRHLPAGADEDALILVDVFGATPCNAAQRVADGERVRLVAGVNVPMLWRTLCYRHETLAALVERATAGALHGVMHVAPARRQNQSPPGPGAHDQVQHPHQQ